MEDNLDNLPKMLNLTFHVAIIIYQVKYISTRWLDPWVRGGI